MQGNCFNPTELRSTIRWYFELKNMSIRKAVLFRGPLSVEQYSDLRIYYSQYISSLVSAIEALLEKEYPFRDEFREMLFKGFVFYGHPDGEKNYGYLKELRNAIVHRGEDIAGRGKMTAEGFHFLHAPPVLSTRNGKEDFQAFSPLILGIVCVSESVIGKLILRHLQERNLLQPRRDRNVWLASIQEQTELDSSIPDWVKKLLPNALGNIDFNQIEDDALSSFIQLLSGDLSGLFDAEPKLSVS